MDLLSAAAPFTPELILLAAALLVFLLDVLGVRRLEALGAIGPAATGLAFVLVIADLGFSPLAGLRTLGAGSIDQVPGVGSAPLYAFSSLGLVFQALFLVAAFLVSLASLSRPSRERGAAIFFGLLLLATLGMLLVAIASDLIFLLLAIELTSISTYILVGYTRRDPRSLEAAMKFYIIGALSSTLSFFGASLLFGAYGSTNLFAIRAVAGSVGYPVLALLGYGFLIAGLAFKTTLVPFHAWAVDVYDGAPSDISAFLAGGSKKIGVFALFLVFIGPVLFVRTAGGSNPFAGAPFDIGPVVQVTLAAVAILNHDRRERPRPSPAGDETDARLLVHQPGRVHPDRDHDRHLARARRGDAPGPRPRADEGRGVPRRRRRGRPGRRTAHRRLARPGIETSPVFRSRSP